MAKVSFKYYLQDSYDRDELEDFLMSDQELAPWDADAIAFVNKLDDLEKTEPGSRLIGNVDTQHFPDPSRVTPKQFVGMMGEEQDSWLRDAQGAGLVV